MYIKNFKQVNDKDNNEFLENNQNIDKFLKNNSNLIIIFTKDGQNKLEECIFIIMIKLKILQIQT